jgi:hypothetical protein
MVDVMAHQHQQDGNSTESFEFRNSLGRFFYNGRNRMSFSTAAIIRQNSIRSRLAQTSVFQSNKISVVDKKSSVLSAILPPIAKYASE